MSGNLNTSVRNNLRDYVNKELKFQGIVSRFGKNVVRDRDTNVDKIMINVCFRNVRFLYNGFYNLVEDHVWVSVTHQTAIYNLSIGDKVDFIGRVVEYVSKKTGINNYGVRYIYDISIFNKSDGQSFYEYYKSTKRTGSQLMNWEYVIAIGRFRDREFNSVDSRKLSLVERKSLEEVYYHFIINNKNRTQGQISWLRGLLESGIDLYSLYQNDIPDNCRDSVYEILGNKNNKSTLVC